MPAAKSSGKTRIAAIGMPSAACDAATPNIATSVAVSKPRPNRKPSGLRVTLSMAAV